jgi:hypothetical protein
MRCRDAACFQHDVAIWRYIFVVRALFESASPAGRTGDDVLRWMEYRGQMIVSDCRRARAIRGANFAALLALSSALAGCAGMSDTVSTAFADPAKYDLYDCKQLETERKMLAGRSAELQGLMAKADTATGGAVISELAYRNDYIAIRGQSQFAEEAWRKNKCVETPPPPAKPAAAKPGKSASKPARAARPARPAAPVSTLPKDGSTY